MSEILTFQNVAIALGLYLIGVLALAFVAMRRLDVLPSDYYLAGRGLGTLVLTGTVLASWYSTFAFLGGPGTFYTSGAAWLYFGFFNATGALLFWVIGTRFWLLGQAFDHITPSDLVAQFYEEDNIVRIMVAVIAISALIPYSVIQLTGAARALVGALGAQQYFIYGVFLLMGMVALYLFIGGLRAVAWIDTFQAFVFMPLLVITAIFAVYWAGGIAPGFAATLENNPEAWQFNLEGAGAWYTGALIWIMAWIFVPHMWQRMLMAENPKVIARTSVIAGGVALFVISLSALFIGGLAGGLFAELPAGIEADGIMTFMYTEFFPVGAILITVGAFAAGMSSISSFILTATSMFVRDVVRKPFKPEMSDNKEAQIGRYFTIFFALFVLLFAISPAAEDAIIPLATDGVALVLLYIPVVLGILHWDGASTAGAKWSLILGFIFMQLTIWTPLGDILPYFGPAVYGLLVAGLIFYVVSKATESVPMERQNKMRRVLVKGMRINEHEQKDQPVAPADD